MLALAVAALAMADIDCGTHRLEDGGKAYFDCTDAFRNDGYWWRVKTRRFEVDMPSPFCTYVEVQLGSGEVHKFNEGTTVLTYSGGRTSTGGGLWVTSLNTACDAVITVKTAYEKLYPIETPEPPTPRPRTPTPWTPTPWTPTPRTPTPWTPTPWTPRPRTPAPPACSGESGEVEVAGCGTTFHFPVGQPFMLCDPCSRRTLGEATVQRMGGADYDVSIPSLDLSRTVECGHRFTFDFDFNGFSGQIRCGSSSSSSTGMIIGIVAGVVVAVAAAGAVGFVLHRRRTRAPQAQHDYGVEEPMAAYSPFEASQPPAAPALAE